MPSIAESSIFDRSFWSNILFNMLPSWVIEDVRSRVSTPLGSSEDIFNVLFTQYNLIIYVIFFCCFLIIFSYLVIRLLKFIQNRSVFLQTHLPRTLGRFAVSKTLIAMIILSQFSILMNFYNIFNGLMFLYNNPIPADLGSICDSVRDMQMNVIEKPVEIPQVITQEHCNNH